MSRRRKRLLIAVGPLLMLCLIFGGFWLKAILDREAQFRESERLLNEVVADLDATDPGWRWADRVARKNDLPDDENIFVQVRRVKALLDKQFDRMPSGAFLFEMTNVESNQLRDPDDIAVLREHQARYAPAVAVAARIENLSRGFVPSPADRTPDPSAANPYEIKTAGDLLRHEVEWLALGDRPREAIPLIRAMLTLAGSVGEDGLLIGCLSHGAYTTVACRRVERLLGLTEPGPDLRTVLEALDRLAGEDAYRRAVRGERAYCDGFYCYLEAHPEKLRTVFADLADFDRIGDKAGRTPGTVARYYEPLMKADHAQKLRGYTEILKACDRPVHERWAVIRPLADRPAQVEATLDGLLDLLGNDVSATQLYVLAAAKVVNSHQREVANIHSARVLIACELFRSKNRHWPNTLSEIPPDLLPEVPTDPYDGKPLRYRVLPDGIAVWSVGEEEIEDPLNRKESDPKPRVNMVYRLWNPESRRCPAPPPRPELLPAPDELPDEERKE